jgi:DNA-binding MarR family transcriptional regulator
VGRLIHITDGGLQRLAAAATQRRELHSAALTGLPETDRAELNRLLLKMIGLP